MTNLEKLSGPWSIQTIETFLAATIIPVRLSVVGSEGTPIVASHWFIYENGVIRCATQQGSAIYKCLQSNGKCGFEISPDKAPYWGIRDEFVLDSLVETSDLQANQNGYQLLAKAIATLSDFEEDERRHRDQVRNQKILAILTTALVVVGLIQALASYDSKPL